MRRSKGTLFDHLIGASEQARREFEIKCPRRFQIDSELELRWLFDRQIGGIRAFENSIDKIGRPPIDRENACTVGHQSARAYRVS